MRVQGGVVLEPDNNCDDGGQHHKQTPQLWRLRRALPFSKCHSLGFGATVRSRLHRIVRRGQAPRRPMEHRSQVVIKVEFVGMWPDFYFLHFLRALVVDPRIYQVFGEHAAVEQKAVIGLERVQ